MTKDRGYTDADMAEVSDNPEWTAERIARAKPFNEVFPELAESIARDGIQAGPAEEFVTLRLDPKVIEHFRASGPGWQSRINDTLKKFLGL
jgi:uncharacterized protein (DUF4415 family)